MKTHITLWLCCCICWFSFGQSISEIEYFFNTDPGFGNGTSIVPNSNTGEVIQSLDLTLPNNATGFNSLYIRAKDDTDTWSLYANAIVYIIDTGGGTAATEISAAEYFLNTDPGFGNGTPITVNGNTGTLTQSIAIPIGTTLNGFNTLYIRTQDDLGVWSLYDNVKFYITEAQGSGASSVTAIEYFIDDPNTGTTTVSLNTNTGNITQSVVIPLGDLDEGFHKIYVKTQDDLGEWSLYDVRLFFVTPEQTVSPIVAAEYFYDTDPGLGNGTSVNLQPTGNLDEFTIDLSTADITCDFHDFYIRLINQDGTYSLYDYGLQVEVFDNADPTIVTFPNITAELDTTGNASITIDDVDNGTFDDCELVSVVLNQTQFNYTCANLGANTVTITATDAEDKVSSEDVTITVVDNINPVAVAQNITVNLDANGSATITPAEIENGSSDNCSIADYALDVTTFDCSNLGANTVNLTVTDTSGNTNSTSAIVTVVDNALPTVVTQNLTLPLDTNGEATLSANQVDNGSSDNCTIDNTSIDVTAFSCDDLGTNTVTLTVTDQSGNSNTGTATITVIDNEDPTVVTQNIEVQLDASGNVSIATNQIENGSSDNCSVASSSLDISTFDCDDLGTNTVTLSVTDQTGNTGTSTATVTVQDIINPVASTKNITVPLDASGNATITADDVDDNSSDNCSIALRSIDVSSFDCSNIGTNTVMLTVEDTSGNTNSASAIVTVVDDIDPVAAGQDIEVDLEGNASVSILASDVDDGSSDNCNVNLSLDVNSFNTPGDYTVILTATDNASNSDSISITVTVIDSTLSIDYNKTSDLDIKLFPIPVVENDVYISTELILDALEVYDISGKTLIEIKQPDKKINITHLKSGIYFFRFKHKNTFITKRVVKK